MSTTGFGRHINDTPNYTAHATQGVVAIAERTEIGWTTGENVTGFMVTCFGGTDFKGIYLTLNAPDDLTALNRLRSNNASAITDTIRVFVPANKPRRLLTNIVVTRVDFVAIDNETPDNNIEVSPL